MIIVDTNVWVDHLRRPDPQLATALEGLTALLHPYVLGELALGSLPDRENYLRQMRRLPRAPVARPHELMRLVEAEELHGSGIGYVDAHLLASCRLMGNSRLWTRDRRLLAQAKRLDLACTP